MYNGNISLIVGMLTTIRGWVSQRKRRLKEDGYNLDLSYITDNIIAMGCPAKGVTGLTFPHCMQYGKAIIYFNHCAF